MKLKLLHYFAWVLGIDIEVGERHYGRRSYPKVDPEDFSG